MLAFVARRIESDPILLLAAARDGYPAGLADAGLPEHRLTGLDDATAAALLDLIPRPTKTQEEVIMTDVRIVVLVHGGFVDGSGWRGVYDLLTADGFNVSVVQNQTLSLESDVETTTNVLDVQDGPTILVGHSYGGAVITEAGGHQRSLGSSTSRPSRPTRASPSAR